MKPFILFDAYGTLCELDDFPGRLQRGFANLGCELPLPDVKTAARAEMKHYIANAMRARDFGAWISVRRECARELLNSLRERGHAATVGVNEAAKTLGAAVAFKPFPETREVLETLKAQGYPMGVVSNWDYRLPMALKSLRMKQFFAFSLSSAQCGVAKPDPHIFARGVEAARRARPDVVRSPADCIYVGDNWENDVRGALQAGLRPLWIVRNTRDVASGETPDEREAEAHGAIKRINSLSELPAILQELLEELT